MAEKIRIIRCCYIFFAHQCKVHGRCIASDVMKPDISGENDLYISNDRYSPLINTALKPC